MSAIQEGVSDLWLGYGVGESGWAAQVSSNFYKIGALLQIAVKSRALTTAPATPADGDCYIPAASATTVWSGKDGYIAVWRANISAWEFYQPKDGWQAVIVNEGTWGTLSTSIGGSWSPGLTLT